MPLVTPSDSAASGIAPGAASPEGFPPELEDEDESVSGRRECFSAEIKCERKESPQCTEVLIHETLRLVNDLRWARRRVSYTPQWSSSSRTHLVDRVHNDSVRWIGLTEVGRGREGQAVEEGRQPGSTRD